MKKSNRLHIPDNIKPYPANYEISAAIIMARVFKCDVFFIKRVQNSKTADFKIMNQIWELKSPVGNSNRTIQNNLRKANKQSANIILDLRRCKMHDLQALSRIKHELKKANSIKRLVVICKNEKVILLK